LESGIERGGEGEGKVLKWNRWSPLAASLAYLLLSFLRPVSFPGAVVSLRSVNPRRVRSGASPAVQIGNWVPEQVIQAVGSCVGGTLGMVAICNFTAFYIL
jgi:hypothetical protein